MAASCNGPAGKKRQNRKNNESKQENDRRDSNVKSNDSSKTPDREQTSDITGLPSEAPQQREGNAKDREGRRERERGKRTRIHNYSMSSKVQLPI